MQNHTLVTDKPLQALLSRYTAINDRVVSSARLGTPRGIKRNPGGFWERPTPTMGHPEFDHVDFLTMFNCHSVPNLLFVRASEKSAVRWNDAGETVSQNRTESPSLFGYANLSNIINLIRVEEEEKKRKKIYEAEHRPWSELYTTTEDFRKHAVQYIGPHKTKAIQFAILDTVLLAWPEQWCEILWDEIEDQLWDVVVSTVVPFLAVLDAGDIETYLLKHSREEAVQYWASFLKFLLRVGLRLKNVTPPNFSDLISEGIAQMGRHGITLGEIHYLQVLKSVTEILVTTSGQPWIAVHKLQEIDHCGSKRSNAVIGLALGSLQSAAETTLKRHDQKSWTWTPISPDDPAAMEIIAQAMTQSDSVGSIPSSKLETISLETKVLLAFCEIGRKAFNVAYGLLLKLLQEVESVYGTKSPELLLAGTALINCCNATGREKEGQDLGKHIAEVGHISFHTQKKVTTKTPQEAHLILAMADSLLGQSSYEEAEELLLQLLRAPSTPRGVSTRAVLRLCKMGRRQQKAPSDFDDWSRLRDAIKNFYDVSDTVKYECLEEVICFLSLLAPEDGSKIPQASEIVTDITKYKISTYTGSAGSRRNFIENLAALRQYRNSLGLFCISGPELDFCRMMRDAYPKANIQFIEKIGAKNWQRSQRIRDLRASAVDGDVKVNSELLVSMAPCSQSVFHDSGLGSSIGSGVKPDGGFVTLSSVDDTKSVISINSNMSTDEDSNPLPDMPAEILSEEPFTCHVCKRVIRGVTRRQQWEFMRHIYQDLRPYTCILEGCNADPLKFTSRADFKTHLIGHIRLWKCTKCGQTEESAEAARIHAVHGTSSCSPNDGDLTMIEVERDLAHERCPFCDKIPGQVNFAGHICHHLEEISLSAIPLEGILDESDEGSNDNVSITSREQEGSVSGGLKNLALGDDESQEKSSPKMPSTIENGRQEELIARGHSQGRRYSKAEESYTRAVEIFEQVLGEKHSDTLLAQKQLAWTLQRQGKYVEAENIYRKVLDSMAETLGSTNLETLGALNNFAVVLQDQGRYVEAEAINRQVLRAREDTLPPDNVYTLQTINNLAEVLDGQDRWEEAKVLYERAIDGRKRVLGTNHSFTKHSIDNLTKMLRKVEEVE